MYASEARQLVQEAAVNDILNKIFSRIREAAKLGTRSIVLERKSYQLGTHGSTIVNKLINLNYGIRWTSCNDLEIQW